MRRGKYHRYLPSVQKRRGRQSNVSVTFILILINVLFFLIINIAFSSQSAPNSFISRHIVISYQNIAEGRIWTLFTSMFMHGGTGHLFVNMISLLFLGSFLEKLVGKKRFTTIYFISGLVAGLFFVLVSYMFGDITTMAVGASGAIFGIAGTLVILTPNLPVLVMFIIPSRLWIAVILLLVIMSFVPGIANSAHFGGAIAGALFGLWLKARNRRKVISLQRFFS